MQLQNSVDTSSLSLLQLHISSVEQLGKLLSRQMADCAQLVNDKSALCTEVETLKNNLQNKETTIRDLNEQIDIRNNEA